MATIRRATPSDIPILARTLALAFSDYRWTRFTVPADDHLQRLEALFTLDLEMIGIPHNETWMSDDGAAVAVWIPPRDLQVHSVDWGQHSALATPLLGDRLAVANAADEVIGAKRPSHAAWYLATTGVHPDHQRRGLGSAVMRPILERCDAEGMACLTETSTTGNVAFYSRLGFDVHAEVTVPDGAPTVWIMWRRAESPRPGRPRVAPRAG